MNRMLRVLKDMGLRKLVFSVLCLSVFTFLVIFKIITSDNYVALNIGVVALFFTANTIERHLNNVSDPS